MRRSRSPFRRNDRNKNNVAGIRLKTPDWERIKLRSFKKKFYTESERVAQRSSARIKDFYEEHNIVIKGHNVPKPIFHFTDVDLPGAILDVIEDNKWKEPTPIQCLGWPIALSGLNVVGIASTGSGKTAAFIVPAIVHIQAQEPLRGDDGPICLVLVPTRELAQQVSEVADDFCRAVKLHTACLYGGAPRSKQRHLLYRKPEIVIATPGRMLDFLECNATNLKRCTYLVLDEADRMLDMGFEPQIRRIIKQVRPDRQTVMWSATWPKEVQSLARDFLSEYIHVSVGTLKLRANSNITQHVRVVTESEKESRLVELLRSFPRRDRVLIFVETKRRADEMTGLLRRRGFSTLCMHGDKAQRERESVLDSFRQGDTCILVATDVASRGLDIDNIKYVINYDYPSVSEDYIHRIGRTGRSDKTGSAYTFITAKQSNKALELIHVLEESNQQVPRDLKRLADSSGGMRRKRGAPMNRWRDVGGIRRNSPPNRSRSRSNEPRPKRRRPEERNGGDDKGKRGDRRSRSPSSSPARRRRSVSSSSSSSRSSRGRSVSKERRNGHKKAKSRSKSPPKARRHKHKSEKKHKKKHSKKKHHKRRSPSSSSSESSRSRSPQRRLSKSKSKDSARDARSASPDENNKNNRNTKSRSRSGSCDLNSPSSFPNSSPEKNAKAKESVSSSAEKSANLKAKKSSSSSSEKSVNSKEKR